MSGEKIKAFFYSAVIYGFLFLNIPASQAAMSLRKFTKPITEVFSDASKTLLSFAGGIALFMIVSAGIYYMFSGTSPERQKGAKKIFSYALLGLVIVLVSYAVLVVIESVAVS